MSMLAPPPHVHRRAPAARVTRRVSELPIHPFQTFEAHLALGDLFRRWRATGEAPAVIQERGTWIGLLDPQDLRARLEAGQHGRTAREVLSPDLDYCFHDTDASEAAEFAQSIGAPWMGVLDDDGRLIGLVARADLASAGSSTGASRGPRSGGSDFGHAA